MSVVQTCRVCQEENRRSQRILEYADLLRPISCSMRAGEKKKMTNAVASSMAAKI